VNIDTYAKYVHIVNMWFDFCLANAMFTGRWDMCPLSEPRMISVACHFLFYGGRERGLACRTLQQYLRMLVHVLVFMGTLSARSIDPTHGRQFDIVQRVVNSVGIAYPATRAIRNTKAAWDSYIVDAGMRLLLLWDTFGHCHLHVPAWPAFARLTVGLFSYMGWRPVSFTHKPMEACTSIRWGGGPVLSFGECEMHWEGDRLVSVQISMLRTKFRRDPLFEGRLGSDELRNRVIGVGKLTYSEDVDTCPVLAWLVWAIINGVFGWAPWEGSFGGGRMGHSDRLQCAAGLTAQDWDNLVDSVIAGRPSCVPVESRNIPLMAGGLLHGKRYTVTTVQMSRAITSLGTALGLDPSGCSAISGRKCVGTAVTNHQEATQMDAAAALGHAQPLVTTLGAYADAKRRCNDTTALIRGAPIRELPGSVKLSHNRNLQPDILAGVSAGRAARQACQAMYAARRRRVRADKVSMYAQNAHNKAFKAEMQRQFDEQARQPRGGNTSELLHHWFFTPLDCSALSPAGFVRWQVKKALQLL
jgi:hypothetical protein